MRVEQVQVLRRESSWHGLHAVVAGIGVAGFAAADALLTVGARVTVVDAADGDGQRERATVLTTLGAAVLLGVDALPGDADLLVVSPGLPPAAPVIRAAVGAGVPVWGELELAWRLRPADASEWLLVTGTNGKTTTTLMLASMLPPPVPTDAVGNIGRSLVDAVIDHGPHDGARGRGRCPAAAVLAACSRWRRPA